MTVPAGMFSLEKANIFLPRSFSEADVPDLLAVDNQKAVVAFPAGMDAYRGILAVMLLQVQLQLMADRLCVDVGFHTGIPFAEHQQHGLVDVVVYQQD